MLGLEASLAASRIIANDPSTCVPGCRYLPWHTPGFDVHHETLFGTLYTATAQVGYAFHRSLWYVKGGWAGAEVRRNSWDSPRACCGSDICWPARRAKHRGWTVGTGIEYLVLQNLSLGVEYDYFRLRGSAFSNHVLSGTGVLGFRNVCHRCQRRRSSGGGAGQLPLGLGHSLGHAARPGRSEELTN